MGVGREANNPTPKKILLKKKRLRPTQGCRAEDDDDDDDDEHRTSLKNERYLLRKINLRVKD